MDTPSLALAERVAAVASERGIDSALIGALALAGHNFVRATQDVDLGVCVDNLNALRDLERRLNEDGLKTRLTYPDDEDPRWS